MQKQQSPKIEVTATIDFVGYSDYWTGHGHVFEDKNLVACVLFSPSVDYSETIKELTDLILGDISFWNAYGLTEDYNQLIEHISDDEIRKAIRELFNGDDKTEVFMGPEYDEFKQMTQEDKDELQDYPQVIGWIHFYKA